MNNNIFNCVLIIFILTIAYKIYISSETFNLRCIISDINGSKYCVRDRTKLKLAADKLFVSANNIKGERDLKFSVVRYGNVMGSRGSVIPLFSDQILSGKPITITDPNMTRFLMSLEESVDLDSRQEEEGTEGSSGAGSPSAGRVHISD